MPHELFDTAVVRPASRARSRRVLSAVSVAVHIVAIAAIAVAQLLATGPLPPIHRPLEFDYIRTVPADVPLPPPTRRPAGVPAITESLNAAPIVEPRGVAPETGFEGAAGSRPGEVVGVEGGTGPIGSIGVADNPPPPPARPVPPQPMRLHSGMQPPRKIVDEKPVYPTIAQTARVEGVVILEAIIGIDGSVQSVKVLRSIPLLDQAAIDAVRRWRYTPAQLNGEAVPVVMTVTVTFTLAR